MLLHSIPTHVVCLDCPVAIAIYMGTLTVILSSILESDFVLLFLSPPHPSFIFELDFILNNQPSSVEDRIR